jgi:hypothetical protein
VLDKPEKRHYNKVRKQREENTKMAKKNTRGTYIFEDGYEVWVNGMSARERSIETRKHGKIVRFIPD